MEIKVEYIDHMGSDLTVVNAARVSFDKESYWEEGDVVVSTDPHDPEASVWSIPRTLPAADTKLIKYLATHNHWTPFSHPQITLRETVPLFVARERFRHTIGFSYNEVSRRYVKSTPEFYAPEYWREAPQGSIKQGSGSAHPLDYDLQVQYHEYLDTVTCMYNAMIDANVAPELARMVLPQSMMTSYYVTGSLAAFARLYKLRKDPSAQVEIQLLADGIHGIIQPLFPVSWGALTNA